MSAAPAVTPAGPFRRLGAMVYDALLVIALFMVVTGLFLLATSGRRPESNLWLLSVYRLLLLTSLVCFFGFFWTRKGCTLGMQAWRLRIEKGNGTLPTWPDAVARLLAAMTPWLPAAVIFALSVQPWAATSWKSVGTALLGIGLANYLAAYWSVDKLALHERWLDTRIVRRY